MDAAMLKIHPNNPATFFVVDIKWQSKHSEPFLRTRAVVVEEIF